LHKNTKTQPEYEEQQHELEYKEPPFVLIKSNSALKDFVEQYAIDGRHRYDPESFLKVFKEAVTNKLQSHRQIKVKMILKCKRKRRRDATLLLHKKYEQASQFTI